MLRGRKKFKCDDCGHVFEAIDIEWQATAYSQPMPCPKWEHWEKIEEQEQKVKSLVWDRRQMMDSTWVHNVENTKRIGRTNRLLMRAVSKTIKLGK